MLTLWIVSIILLFIYVRRSLKKYKISLPPGPPGLPLLGHLLTIPQTHQEYFFYELGKLYGDIIHLHIPTRSYIVLNSVQAAVDLLEKRSHNYSDRPPLLVLELMGFVRNVSVLRYGSTWQLHRRMIQQYFHQKESVSYRPVQTREAHVLLQSLLSTPDKRDSHISQFSTSVILRITFGHQVTSDEDEYLKITKSVSHALANSGSPGGTPIDFFPFLQYFPSWFPGTYFAQYARTRRPVVDDLHFIPLAHVQEQMAKGTAKSSFVASNLEALMNNTGIPSNTIPDIQGAAGAIYGAGAETTWSSISIFFLAMMFNPECQARAQKEIDTVIGTGRLPGFEDRDSLPYVNCLVRETFRWNHPVPLGVPHYSLEDDVYNGLFIPKGSIVIANTKGMSLDERVYSNPSSFNPSRYLPKPQGLGEPFPIAHFGFGRRICPGRHLADASTWIVAASILATMEISMALDKDGKEIVPKLDFTSGISSHPLPFQCSIRPRNETARRLILDADLSDNYY